MSRRLPIFAVLLATTFVHAHTQTRPAASGTWLLTTTAAPDREVAVTSLTPEGVTVLDAGATRTLAPSEFVRLVRAVDAPATIGADTLVLHLRGGQRLPGTPAATLQPDAIGWAHPVLGTLSFPLKAVRGVGRGPVAPAAATTPEDSVLLLNGDTLRGVVTEVTPESVTITPSGGAGGDPATLPWRSVRALALADLSAASGQRATPEPGFRLELTDGTALRVPSVSVAGDVIKVTPPGATAEVELPATAVRLIESAGVSVWSLSLLPPEEVVHRPFLTVTRPPRFDGNAAGGAVVVAGKAYPRAISATAFTRLTWSVPEGFTRVRLSLALDPSADRGAASVRLLADDKPLGEPVALLPGAAVVAVDQPLNGVKRLTLEVDFGTSHGVQSRALILDPLLIK